MCFFRAQCTGTQFRLRDEFWPSQHEFCVLAFPRSSCLHCGSRWITVTTTDEYNSRADLGCFRDLVGMAISSERYGPLPHCLRTAEPFTLNLQGPWSATHWMTHCGE